MSEKASSELSQEEKISYLLEENKELRKRLIAHDYEIIALRPRQSGPLYNLKQGYRNFRECDKRIVAARGIGTIVALLLIVAFHIALERAGIDNEVTSLWGHILAILIGWKAHQFIKFKLLKKPTPVDENIIFIGWLMASFVIICTGTICGEMGAAHHSLWRQLLVALLALPITLFVLLFIAIRQKRQLDAFRSSEQQRRHNTTPSDVR